MPAHRSYTRTRKAEVVGQSEVVGVRATSRATGVPPSTIQTWRQSEEFAQLRAEKREDVAQDVWGAFQLGLRRVLELIPLSDDLQKVATATAIIYDKYALISGEATHRTETRDITDTLDDHERDVLTKVIRDVTSVNAGD